MYRLFHVVFFLFLSLLFCAGSLKADKGQDFLTSGESFFVDLVNIARSNPGQAMQAAGYTPDQIANDNPDFKKIFESSLPHLVVNKKLSTAAALHAREMLERGYFSYVSPEGVAPKDRISDQGYFAVASGELLGIITFKNYITNKNALGEIFTSFLEDEVSAEDPIIFSPVYKDIGVSFHTGQIKVGGSILDVNLLVCYFGSSRETIVESHLHRQINAARFRPADAISEAGLSVGSVHSRWNWDSGLLYRSLAPLAAVPDLSHAASACLQKMLDDPLTVPSSADADLASICGYDSDNVAGNAFFLIPLDAAIETDNQEAARLIYSRLLEQEAFSYGPEHIFLPGSDMVGIAVKFLPASDCIRLEQDMLAALVLSAKQMNEEYYVFGYVFSESDEVDGSLSLSAVSGAQVIILDLWTEEVRSSTLTDIAGAYRLPAESEDMVLLIDPADGSDPARVNIKAGGRNVAFDQFFFQDGRPKEVM